MYRAIPSGRKNTPERARGLECSQKAKAFLEDRRYHLLLDFRVFLDFLQNLRGRLLSSEKFSEFLTIWVSTLKLFPETA